MILIIRKLFQKLSGLFSRLQRLSYRVVEKMDQSSESIRDANMRIWLNLNGDKTLRVEYPTLTHNSVVIDVGGYEGDWTAEIAARYGCTVHVFEPVQRFIQLLRSRFGKNLQLAVHPYGLGKREERPTFWVIEESSTQFEKEIPGHVQDASEQEVLIRPAVEVFSELALSHVSLIKLNIEGGEYDLLQHLIESEWINRIDHLQIQFHDFVPDAVRLRDEIRAELAKTHTQTYYYEWVWENWTRKGIQ